MTKTIEISLKDSEMNGTKIAHLSNRIARVYVIPRKKIEFLGSRKELTEPALYFLFDEDRTTVYIGECENAQARISQHDAGKDFWDTVVICNTSDSGFDKADVKFLESVAIQRAIEVGRLDVQNKTSPAINNLKEFKREANLELFEDFELLLATLGFNVFTPQNDSALARKVTPKIKDVKERDDRDFDTIICPTSGKGRENAFEKKQAWWAVRIWKGRLNKFKYVGLYESAPVSAIRCYAKIVRIEPFADEPGKYIIHHDGNIVELEHPVALGDNPELSLYGPRYYKLSDIKSSTTMAELTDKTFGSNYSRQHSE